MFRKQFCPVCKKNGRSEAEYTSHNPREGNDETSRPLCPILLDMKCNRCGNVGHIAAKCPSKSCVFCNQAGHTVYYCRNAPRAEIDDFLRQRNIEYEDRKMRNNNNRNDRREISFRQDNFERPNMFASSRAPYERNNNNRFWRADEPPQQNYIEESHSKNYNDFAVEDTNTYETKQVPVDDFPSLDKVKSVVEPADEFPSLGKAKTVNVPKMNFAGVASIMTDPLPKISDVSPVNTSNNHNSVNKTQSNVYEDDLDIDEYRDRLFDNMVDDYYASGRNNTEPWDMAYKRITRTVDRDVDNYGRYLAQKNARNNNNNNNRYYEDDDNNW